MTLQSANCFAGMDVEYTVRAWRRTVGLCALMMIKVGDPEIFPGIVWAETEGQPVLGGLEVEAHSRGWPVGNLQDAQFG